MGLKPLLRVVLVALLFNACLSTGQKLETLQTADPRPTGSDPITITTGPTGAGFTNIVLHYTINYDNDEKTLDMIASDGSYTATIPVEDAKSGYMVRWFVTAELNGRKVRDPEFNKPTEQEYYGTIVEDTSDSHTLPVLELYCKDPQAPYITNKDTPPGCSFLYRNKFYDNIVVRRRGSSSLNWPKPKFKVDAGDQGKIFDVADGFYELKEFNMNSEWAEPGENTFMRDSLAWKVFKATGVDWLLSYQTVVRLNGQYYGKYALGEDWDNDPLQRNGYSFTPTGFLWSAFDGENGNLRWDVPADQISYYYNLTTQKSQRSTGEQKLAEFNRGISGGGSVSRSKYLFDAVNLPRTINHLAAQTIILNQDRCTKNHEIYYEPSSQQWSFLPWDLESTFSSDRGLGGGPNLNDYCTLACEQWNSPLYCDKDHPQDLQVSTPWTLITTTINPNTLKGRKLAQSSSSGSGGSGSDGGTNGSGSSGTGSGTSNGGNTNGNNGGSSTSGSGLSGITNPGLTDSDYNTLSPTYDTDLTKQGSTATGAPGTFNYLIDAILSVPRTRAMYLRRVRTLMDAFLPSGRLQSLVTEEYNAIKDEAKRDAVKWGNPGSPDRGYEQLITMQLPTRKDQLYNTYGPNGETPLIPEGQPSDAVDGLSVGEVRTGGNGWVEVVNDNEYAVDISGWKLLDGGGGDGGSVLFEFLAGTVVAAKDSVYVSVDSVGGFLGQKGGQGLFVVGPMKGDVSGSSGLSISQ